MTDRYLSLTITAPGIPLKTFIRFWIGLLYNSERMIDSFDDYLDTVALREAFEKHRSFEFIITDDIDEQLEKDDQKEKVKRVVFPDITITFPKPVTIIEAIEEVERALSQPLDPESYFAEGQYNEEEWQEVKNKMISHDDATIDNLIYHDESKTLIIEPVERGERFHPSFSLVWIVRSR